MPDQEKEPKFNAGNNQVGSANTGCSAAGNQAEKKDPEKKKIKIRASMFFDGTKNNKYNISMRKKMEEDSYFKNELKEAIKNEFRNIMKEKQSYRSFNESIHPDRINNQSVFYVEEDAGEISINETSDERILSYMQEKHYLTVAKLKDDLIAKNVRAAYGSSIESFTNDYTNVVKLEEAILLKEGDYDKHVKIYTDGQGTEGYGSDNTVGFALGSGSTGVDKKAEKGLEYLILSLNSQLLWLLRDAGSNKENISLEVTLDAFGFSRGAAAARYFLYIACLHPDKKIKAQMAEEGYVVNKVKVCFVGLFDTVAAYAYNYNPLALSDVAIRKYFISNGKPFSNNTEVLHLDAVSYAERAIQLSSADEHRIFFALTNICSSPNGTEIFLPGVHSDIGGGYDDRRPQNGLILLDLSSHVKIKTTWYGSPYLDPDSVAEIKKRIQEETNRLIEEGWIYPHEIDKKREEDFSKLIVTRTGKNGRGLRNTYSRIPLHIMIKYAGEHGLQFNEAILKTKHEIPAELQGMKNAIDEYVSKGVSNIDDWKKTTPKDLRREYLHCSSYYGETVFGAYDPYFEGGPLTGFRKRIVFDG